MSYFVTGTDTGVGKTLIACALLHAFAAQGKRVVGMKPVAAGGSPRSSGEPTDALLAGAAGFDADGINADVQALAAASNVTASFAQINPYAFAHPVAPHIAARKAGVHVEFARILTAYGELAAQSEVVVIEGVGGFHVPLNDTQDSADLAVQLGLPVILVVGMRLGCLNHALLTARAIEDCGLNCAGWVANVLDADMAALHDNIVALQQRLNARLLGVVEYQARPDARLAAMRLNLGILDGTETNDA